MKLVAEIDASVSDFMTIARLYCSGLNFTYNPHRMILNKVTDCYLMKAQGEGNREEIEDDKLYHVVTDLYTGQMLGAVMDTSYGLLSITPKDKDGNPIENLEDQAIMEGNQELKHGLPSPDIWSPLMIQMVMVLQMCRNIIMKNTTARLWKTAGILLIL